MSRKDIIRCIKYLKKLIKNKSTITVWGCGYWDIYEKRYSEYEIAARFLRKKGYNISIDISSGSCYVLGYVRFRRYSRISFI